MKQQETFAANDPLYEAFMAGFRSADTPENAQQPTSEFYSAFLLGRAVVILEGLIESPTDALDIQLARDLLADYRKWMESES